MKGMRQEMPREAGPMFRVLILFITISQASAAFAEEPQIVSFASGNLTLRGELFLPIGQGPF
ncbi:MAG: hypothetical protein ABIY63_19930, partial [Fibrobacteria bacterium]